MKTWDTRRLAPTRQFGFWREVLCEAFTALDSIPEAPRDFGSAVVLHELADLNAAALHSFAQNVVRGWPEIRRRADEFYFANLQLAGRCVVEQDGREIEVGPGCFYLVDTTRPYRLHFLEAFRTLSFRLPQSRLRPCLHRPAGATAITVDGGRGLGALAVAEMHRAMRVAPELPPDAAGQLSTALVELIAAAVSGQLPTAEASRQQVRRAFRERIVRHVEACALDTGLSVGGVARHFRVSPRYIHDVFAERSTSFMQRVLDLRLAAAAQALRRDRTPVTEIALAVGFSDPSYFGRAFRQRYGCTPRDWRQDDPR